MQRIRFAGYDGAWVNSRRSRKERQMERAHQLLSRALILSLFFGLVPADVSRGRIPQEPSRVGNVGSSWLSDSAFGTAEVGSGEILGRRPEVICSRGSGPRAIPLLRSAGQSAIHMRGGGLPGYSYTRIPQPPEGPPPGGDAVQLPTPPLSPPPLPDPVPTVSQSKVAKCVLPEVAANGSVVDAVGWVLAFLTCSLKLRKQLRLDERLWLAAARGDASLCERLIAKGADVTAESHDGGDDPRVYFKDLYGLTFYEEQEKMAELAKAAAQGGKAVGAPHEIKRPSSKPPKRLAAARTALRWAAFNGHLEAVKALLGGGSELDAGDAEGYTALHEASLYGHTQVVEALLAHKANVNVRTDEAWLPLHLAAAYGHLDVVKLLQEAGADLCAMTEGGLTAMDWAKAYGYIETSEFLRTCSGDRHGNCQLKRIREIVTNMH